MKGTIVAIGDELLIGQTVDTNSAWLGNQMTLQGIEVLRGISIQDKYADIQSTISEALESSDIVIVTGGLGPTKDDITKKAIADYVGCELAFDQELCDRIEKLFADRNITFLPAHREQCYMPVASMTLYNRMGTAPGMLFPIGGKHGEVGTKYILSMPGVPYEMKWIYENSFLPLLPEIKKDASIIYNKTIKTVGTGETAIADKIQYIIDEFPPEISIAYLPSLGHVKVRLTAKSFVDMSDKVNGYSQQISDVLGNLVYGYDDMTLTQSLQDLFIEKGLTLSTAESCTGGYLAHLLTLVAGSSQYYMGSIIAYDYQPKKELLQVKASTLESTGAVSEETVTEMLTGLLINMRTDMGIAISGIAGPGGGTPDKPVGTIWMAWGNKDDIRTRKLKLGKNRENNIKYTAVTAINALRKFIIRADVEV